MKGLNTPEMSSTVANRDWEDAWGRRLQEAFERYQAATARYRDLLETEPEGQIHSLDDPLTLARRMESEALLEYRRLLKIVSELDLRHSEIESGEDGKADSHFNC